jgi:hypothetical protein
MDRHASRNHGDGDIPRTRDRHDYHIKSWHIYAVLFVGPTRLFWSSLSGMHCWAVMAKLFKNSFCPSKWPRKVYEGTVYILVAYRAFFESTKNAKMYRLCQFSCFSVPYFVVPYKGVKGCAMEIQGCARQWTKKHSSWGVDDQY